MAQIIPYTKNILVVAGDVSADIHASNMVREIKNIDPNINVASIGGDRLAEASDKFIYNLVQNSASGFLEPLKKIPLWIRLISTIRNYMEEKNPACVITVDFYGFNHQVLGLAKHRNIPAYHYISPQVWASRAERAGKLSALVKRIFVILPFEEKIYKDIDANVEFVGHPLLDIMPESVDKKFNSKGDWKIGILPGSRPGEIKRHMPLFYQTIKQVKKIFPKTKSYVFAVPEVSDEKLLGLCGDDNPKIEIVRETDYSKRKDMDFILTCSGTASLENSILGVPMLVCYKMSFITYIIAKAIISVDYISLINILANKKIVKEFIQSGATSQNLSTEIIAMFQNPDKLKDMRNEMLEVCKTLGKKGASKRVAGTIMKEIFLKR